MRLLSVNGSGLAIRTRVILASTEGSGSWTSVGAAVGIGVGVACTWGLAPGALIVGPAGVAGASVAAGAAAVVAAGAAAVVAAGAGAVVAVGSSPPHATIIATENTNSQSGLNTSRLRFRNNCITCRLHETNDSAHASRIHQSLGITPGIVKKTVGCLQSFCPPSPLRRSSFDRLRMRAPLPLELLGNHPASPGRTLSSK